MVEIRICMGSSCYSRGNERNRRIIEDYLKRNKLEAKVDFRGNLCTGLCGQGPNLYIDGKLYQRLDEGVLIDVLNKTFQIMD